MENIWWNQVTNAVRFVNDIKQSLLDEKSILISYSHTMPWRDYFVDTIKDAVKLVNAEKKFVDIPIVQDIGKYLLNEFCKKEKRTEYRPSKGYAKFFAENDDLVFHDRYFWCQVNDEKNLNQWGEFASDYIKGRDKKDYKAVFVLEWSGKACPPIKKGIKVFDFDDYIGEYDRIVFAVLASSCVKEDTFIKGYLSELVSNISGNDIELASECINRHKAFLDDPLSFIRKTCLEKRHSDGSEFEFKKDENMIQHLIWLSQIKKVYPHLEEYREDFVSKHSEAILKHLPIQASYGEYYTDPKDVELGTLVYMVGSGSLILSINEYEKLKCHKEARNKLSHLSVLSIKEIVELL